MNNISDYKSWLIEEKDILDEYKKTYIYDRYEVIFEVLDNLSKNDKLDDDFEVIFEMGFQFIENQISSLKIWAKTFYNNDYKLFFKNSKTILLMIYINENLNEFENVKDLDKIKMLEEDVFTALKSKNTVSDELYDIVLKEINKIYVKNKIENIDMVNVYNKIAEMLKIDLY